jgi:hypothetical protein
MAGRENTHIFPAGLLEHDTTKIVERIISLPGVRAEQPPLAGNSLAINFFIEPPHREAAGSNLLCHLGGDGLLLPVVAPDIKNEILGKGWASGAHDGVVLFLPRDDAESEVTWQIVLLTYRYLTTPRRAADDVAKRKPELPAFSSTARYWE